MKHEARSVKDPLHRKLNVWNSAIKLAISIYRITQKFPSEEKFGFTTQMRKAAVSIGSNIAEGAARQTSKEYIQFLYIASASASKLDTQLVIVDKVGFIDGADAAEIKDRLRAISQMLHGLMRRLKKT